MSPRILADRLRGRVIARVLSVLSDDRAVPAPRRPRPSSIGGLSHQVAAFADEGASSSQIAQRTGLAHDAIALILHFRTSPRPEGFAGRGTFRRVDLAPWARIADA